VKKLIGFLAGDLEADETELLSGNNRLPTLTAPNYGSKFHGMPREPLLRFPARLIF